MKDKIIDLSPLKPKQGKKRVNSKAKGSTFERQVCKMLNEKFETDEFCRTPGSGAFATTHKLPKHLQIHGDIICPQNFSFVFELKAGYSKVPMGDLFNRNSELWKFARQVEKDAKKAEREPIIIWKQNRKDILIIFKDFQLSRFLIDEDIASIKLKEEDSIYYISKLNDVLECVPNSYFFKC